MADLGEKLRELRRQRRLSLYDVERLTGLHFSTIGKYERNLRRPNLDTLRELAAVYRIPVGELVSDTREVIDLLPEHLKRGARLLAERADLARLLDVAERLGADQVARLNDFLASIAGEDQPAAPPDTCTAAPPDPEPGAGRSPRPAGGGDPTGGC